MNIENVLKKVEKSPKAQEWIRKFPNLNWEWWDYDTENKSSSQLIQSVKGFIKLQERAENLKLENPHIDFSIFKGKIVGENGFRSIKSFIKFMNNLQENQHELLSDYIDTTTDVLIDFKCGHNPSYVKPIKYWVGRKCLGCLGQSVEQAKNDFFKMTEEQGHEVLTEYIDSSTKVLIDYNCGHEPNFITPNSYKAGHGCPKCAIERNSGVNNPRYNHNLTEEDRERGRKYEEYYQWTNNVLKRDNYRCQCCGEKGGKLNAHHLDGYNWCVERRVDISNGVTLCKYCHIKFHKEYGYGDNTEKQFKEWLDNNKTNK